MGVKTHYIYEAPTGNIYVDMRAYFALTQLLAGIPKKLKDPYATAWEGIKPWRRKIEPIYETICAVMGEKYGRLRVLKTANPYKDEKYRSLTMRRRPRNG